MCGWGRGAGAAGRPRPHPGGSLRRKEPETNDSSLNSIYTGDCLSIRSGRAGRPGGAAEYFPRELITRPPRCLVQFAAAAPLIGTELLLGGFLPLGRPACLPLGRAPVRDGNDSPWMGRLIKLFIIDLNQYVWIVGTSLSRRQKVILIIPRLQMPSGRDGSPTSITPERRGEKTITRGGGAGGGVPGEGARRSSAVR